MQPLTFAELSFNAQQTPVSDVFDDIYFSPEDGLAESRYVFQEGNQLWERWQNHMLPHFVIAETGFGTGLNFLAVAAEFQRFRDVFPNACLKRLYFISFEKYPLTAEQLVQVHQAYPQFQVLSQQLTTDWMPRQVGCERYHFDGIVLDLWFGEMADSLDELGDYHHGQIDSWFLDGFSPDKNPAMWNAHLYREMFRLSRNGGSFATFTAAGHVRRGLVEAGFVVEKRKGFGKKREMIFGHKPQEAPTSGLKFPYFYQSRNIPKQEEVAIIGGGAAAFCTAWALIERGKKVVLYCRDNEVGEAASGNLQGAVYPQLSDDDNRNVRFYLHSFDYALRFYRRCQSYFSFEQAFSGVALTAYDEKNGKKWRKLATQFEAFQVIKWEEADSLSEKVGLPLSMGGGWIEEGGWISPKQWVQNGFRYLQERGLRIVCRHEVPELDWNGQAWEWQYQGEHFSHETVVLANGHRFKQFRQSEGIPLYPVRGQVSHIPTTVALSQLKSVLCYDGYLTPKSAGNWHCVGASHVRDNEQEVFSSAEHQQNFVKLSENLTACEWGGGVDFSAEQGKVGIRAALRDRMPIVGAVPNYPAQKEAYRQLYNQLRRKETVAVADFYPNLYMLNGLGSRGLTTAPLLGEMLASQICGEPLPLSEEIHQVLTTNRSWIRQLVRGRQVE